MHVCVNCNDKRWRKYKIDFEKIANAAAINTHKESEVSIVLTNDSEIHALNKKYRNIDKPTNVLSFELGDDILLGDIYISLDTVVRQAADENISVAEHAAHMVVHGMLHLQGFDHIKNSDAKIMEGYEVKILKKLGIKNPYAQDTNVCRDSLCCASGGIIAFLHGIKIRQDGFAQYVLMTFFGVIAALGFAPFNIWLATVVGIGGAYLIAARGATIGGFLRSLLRILPFSFAYSVAMFWWTVHSIYVVPELTAHFAIWTIPALLGIGLVGGIVFAIPFVAISCMRMYSGARVILFATVWTFVLWLREWAFTGFPWNPIANISLPWGALANSMSLWGALGLTFVITGLIACLAELLHNYKSRGVRYVFFVFVLFVLCGVFCGIHNIRLSEQNDNFSPTIRVVQPAQSQAQKSSHSRAAALQNAEHNLRNLYSLAVSDGIPDLIVFPETSYPFVVTMSDNMQFAKSLGTNIVIGANVFDNGHIYNSMVFANSAGAIVDIYSKVHLVPFGEYGPFGDIIPSPVQLTPGSGAGIITLDLSGREFKVAPAICYEIIFSDSLVLRDAGQVDAIINITNDTWFGKTPGTYQHLDMVRRYAIESGLPIIRANYSGVSAFVASDGHIISGLPVAQPGYMDGVVWGAHMTPYRCLGRNVWMIIILIVACVGIQIIRRIK